MVDLKELTKKRGSVKGRLTSFVNYVNSLADDFTSTQAIELQVRFSKIDALLDQFDDIQTSIECAIDDKDSAIQYAERQDFENQFFSIYAMAQEMLAINASKRKTSDDQSSSSRSSVSGKSQIEVKVKETHTSNRRGVKLPTMQVTKFSGQFEDWLEFRDTFSSLVHDQDIGDIQKFHYLRASVEGDAAQIIRSLEFSSNNYQIAWDLLCDRYNNNRLLTQNHLRSLFSAEQMKRESARSIRKLMDSFTKHLRSLEILGEPTKSWDSLIIYIMNSKLDSKTSRVWEEQKSTIKKVTLKEFMEFLKNRADLLDAINMDNKVDKQTHRAGNQGTDHVRGLATVTDMNTNTSQGCPVCNQDHRTYRCDTFKAQSVSERADTVRRLKLCNNCLRPGHQARACRLGPCTLCSRKHNTLLHENKDTKTQDSSGDSATSLSVQLTERVLLSTALVYIYDRENRRHEARAVLDSGSQASFMTETLHGKLKLKHTAVQTSVVGINNSVSQITKRCDACIESRVTPYEVKLSFLVLPNISNLCKHSTRIQKLCISKDTVLADPEYYSPSSIDLLLGADIFWDLLDQGQIRIGPNSPILQQTKFGYIVSGPTSGLRQASSHTSDEITCNYIHTDNIQEQLAKFWSLEETPDVKHCYTNEERLCEADFASKHTRMPGGRFSAAIPLKMPDTCLGNSFDKARQCFLSLERRLERLPKLRQMYRDFIAEYKDLGHMSPKRSDTSDNTKHSYYLPHHGVLRENSATTKLRVVFNASFPTSTGVSCNDIQMVGPTIQSDLFSILLRFRHYTYVMTGDIEKMYRQVLIHENQRHLQNIIWRDDSSKELQVFQLNTVTYGTAAAPFLAIRCLKQLAIECEDKLIAQIISDDFYVDDLVTGSQSISQLAKIRDDVCKVLSTGCFNLRKIRSNVDSIMSTDTDSCVPLNLGEQDSMPTNTLGLGWSSSHDELYFSQKPELLSNPTKRSVLSTIGQIFDPLGLLTVFIIQAKIILQKLWLCKISWDEPLPSEVAHIWHKFTSELTYLNSLRIPRCVTCGDPRVIELHTFCDSSQDAYGACVFVRSTSANKQVQTHLLCAKSKVAPLKPVTIPRLELCGALVAARLLKKVLQAFRLPVLRCILWTDSSIVLGWLQTAPNKLKQFVKNRVFEIQETTQSHEWRHVPTKQNPADLLTRGVNMSDIQDLDLWWTGPSFLHESEENWPKSNFTHKFNDLPEFIAHVAVSETSNSDADVIIDFSRFSKLNRLKRAFAYTLRFVHNCKPCNSHVKLSGPLSVSELENAFTFLLKMSQIQSFTEYKLLQNKKDLPNKNALLHLSPFLDETGLIRVGGRLGNSRFEYDQKHPILLSCKHPIARLIFTEEHIRLFHAAPQLLLSSVRLAFWPLGGRNMARVVAHKCQRCFRMKPHTVHPIMGQLPEQRVTPGYPFQTTGVDYAGPLLAADRRGRGCRLIKVYVAVFVCFTTKAIHLELVTDLTKDAYIAALRRFIARRSKPSVMFSDNGTQFVGAKNEISQFIRENSYAFSEIMATDNIDFKFIPAYTPHFGGLWEAGVKSFKFHLVRVLGDSRLTFEELYTTLVQIESILNSRPLSPISPDPNDLNPLTPGHFLVGRPLTALPSPKLDDENPNRLQRWERVEQLRQHFWIRWQKEYVSELQQKTKWRASKGSLKKGTLVIIKEEHLPPMKWCLGRIQEVYAGSDGVNRVADMRTSKGVIRRAFTRICPLPLEDSKTTSS